MMGVMRRVVLALLLAACGDDGVRHTPDASTHDGPVDAPEVMDPVTVTVTRADTAIPGVHVYFQNVDSSLVLATTTDANGTASAVMEAGGYVTAVDPFPAPGLGGITTNQLATWVGVKPGDHLRISEPGISTMQVTVNASFDPAATSTWVYSSCLLGGEPLNGLAATVVAQPGVADVMLENCGPTTNFLLVSFDDNGLPLNMAFFPDTAVVDQGMVNLTPVWAGVDAKSWTFNNGPALTGLEVQEELLDARGIVYSMLFDTPSDQQNPTVTDPMPVFPNATEVVQTDLYTTNYHALYDWGPYASTYTVDVGARMLAELTGPPSFDAATHAISITEAATGATASYTATSLRAQRAADTRQWIWQVASPHATTITLPTLPTDIYDFNVRADDSVDVPLWGIGKVPGGYDAIRAFAFVSTNGPSGFVSQLGASGEVTVEQYEPPPTVVTARDTMGGHAPALFSRRLSRRVR
jgi:hypothetical protein